MRLLKKLNYTRKLAWQNALFPVSGFPSFALYFKDFFSSLLARGILNENICLTLQKRNLLTIFFNKGLDPKWGGGEGGGQKMALWWWGRDSHLSCLLRPQASLVGSGEPPWDCKEEGWGQRGACVLCTCGAGLGGEWHKAPPPRAAVLLGEPRGRGEGKDLLPETLEGGCLLA